jgi:hypothetical protein
MSMTPDCLHETLTGVRAMLTILGKAFHTAARADAPFDRFQEEPEWRSFQRRSVMRENDPYKFNAKRDLWW